MPNNTHSIKLYHKERYEVIVGKDSVCSLCTCWNDPKELIKKFPKLKQYFRIIGTLYSIEGVSIILRNLALNPQIKYLFLWDKHQLSKTPLGRVGTQMLKKFWRNGLEKKGNKVKNTTYNIHKEIDPDIADKIRKNVQLIFTYKKDLGNIIERASSIKVDNQPYMKTATFPDTQHLTSKTFPSEEIGWVVRGKKVMDAWLKAIDTVMRYGTIKSTEYGNKQKELQVINWVIEEENLSAISIPRWPSELRKTIGLDKNSISKYKDIFLKSSLPKGVKYTYGQKLRAYRTKTDQIDKIIKKLKSASFTRRAVAFTHYPPKDLDNTSPPCLTQIQVLVGQNKKMNMIATFRSQDLFKAAISNAFGLLHLQNFISKKTNLKIGKLSITSNSAHIYEEDWDNCYKLLECKVRSKKTDFNDFKDLDPRGNIVITVEDKFINLLLISRKGKRLLELKGKTARELALKLSKLNLIVKPDHLVDITIELVKAEISLKKKLKYTQDKPLTLKNLIVR
jgi:thymidylate synthase